MWMRTRVAAWVTLQWVLACSCATHPPAGRTDTPRVAPGGSDAAVTTRTAERRPGSPSVSLPTQTEAATTDLRMLRELDCDEAYLHVLPGKTFLSCGQELLVVERNEVRSDPSYQLGIEREQPSWLWWITDMAGMWPDAVWLGTNRSTTAAAEGWLYHWSDQRWVEATDAGRNVQLSALLPWTDRSVLALVEPANAFGARFMPLGKGLSKAPSFTAPKVPHEYCRSRLRAEAEAVVAPGEIMVAGGQVCDVVIVHGQKDLVHSGIGVERFTADSPHGQLVLLDDLPEIRSNATWEVTALVTVTPSEVLLAAHSVIDAARTVGYLARWDGINFRTEPMPLPGGINKLWVEGPEVLWATDLQGRLWHGHTEGWQLAPWQPPDPADTEITRVWERGPKDVWILTRKLSRSKSAVFHGRWD